MKRPTNHHRILYLVNFLALIGLLLVSYLSNYLPIQGNTAGEVASKYQSLFNPADFTYTIWIIIFTFLVAHMIFLLNGSKNPNGFSAMVTSRIGITFLISCVANAAWVIAWHFEHLITTVILLSLLLLSLIDINLRINKIGREPIEKRKYFIWLVKVPFGLYLGWICITIINNISIYLVANGWEGFSLSEGTWTIVLIIFSGFLGLLLLSRLQSYAAAIAIAWGLSGLLYTYWSSSSFASIQYTAVFAIALLAIGTANSYRKTAALNLKNRNHD